MDLAGPAYIAMKSKSDDWLSPGILHDDASRDKDASLVLPIDSSNPPSNPAAGPPKRSHYAPIVSAKARVVRDYGGINSSGGPQVSGRADQKDFEIVMQSHDMSPILYGHCCGGIQLKWVHLCVPQGGSDDPTIADNLFMHIRMEDVNVTGYRMTGLRKAYHLRTATPAQSKKDYGIYDIKHLDRLTLLYTSISFLHGGTKTGRGWNTGSEVLYTPS